MVEESVGMKENNSTGSTHTRSICAIKAHRTSLSSAYGSIAALIMVAMHSLTSDNHPSLSPAILNDGSQRTVRAAVVKDILERDNIPAFGLG